VAFCKRRRQQRRAQLAGAGVDTLVTGELREEWFNRAEEEKLNLYSCGHYATEVHGVKALAAELARKFKLPWEFIATVIPLNSSAGATMPAVLSSVASSLLN